MGTGLYITSRALDKTKSNSGEYTFFKLPYFNYTRPEIDFRYFDYISRNTMLVYRLNSGIGVAYWNSQVLPFESQFYTGGSNSIRAFRARSVGPGGFQGVNNSNLNIDQTGEMKIEGNIEYRFHIMDRFIGSKLKGATFFDMGNVWTVSDANTNKEGLFEWSEFYKQFAMGTGIGLRLDYSFLLFRFDLGLKIRDPRFTGSDRWVLSKMNDEAWKRQNNYSFWNFNFGIGYPF
jgi:outer membrane protein assembly factor BamA